MTATQTNNAGNFTFSTAPTGTANSCSGIASESAGTGAGVFTITPQAVGHCTFTVTGQNGMTATLTVDVTNSTVGGQ